MASDQLNEFLESVDNIDYRRIFNLAARTGLRRGELLGLQWSRIYLNLAKGFISIHPSLSRVDGVLVIQKATKNNLIRNIPISARVEKNINLNKK